MTHKPKTCERCKELLRALRRIAEAQPRAKRNRDFDPEVVQSLQRTARVAIDEAGR